MGSSRKAQLCLLSCLVASVAMISCRPLDTQAVHAKSENEGSKAQADTRKCNLSKEQIIDIANVAARRYGWNPKQWITIYDEGNAYWKSRFFEMKTPGSPAKPVPLPHELEGRDYQVVIYSRQDVPLSGDLFIVVDRNTGEILFSLHGA